MVLQATEFARSIWVVGKFRPMALGSTGERKTNHVVDLIQYNLK